MKVNRSNQKQINYSLNKANIVLTKYLNSDLSKNDTWDALMDDVNLIVDKSLDDCLTEEIMIAVVHYLEELRKSELPDTPPVMTENKGFTVQQGFNVQKEHKGFEVQGFNV